VTAEIARQVPRGLVLGVDGSAEMIRFSIENHPAEAFGNLWFVVKDARALDYNEEFDVVFSNAVLHWVVDHGPVLRGIARALRRGGRMLLQMGGLGNAADVLAVVNEMMVGERWRAYFEEFEFPYGFYAPAEYRGWLAEAGLEAGRVELIPKDMVHEGAEGPAGWFRTTWLPYTQRLPESIRGAFVDEAVAKYVERHPVDDQGKVHLGMVRLEVEARKPS